jgi:Ca-activated chloride channel family protein
MKTFIFILLFSSNSFAGLFDFFNIYQAENAYKDKNYSLAGDKFSVFDNDESILNHANSLYKQGLFKQALEKYKTIKQSDLAFDRLYNSGNAYAKSGKINEAIDSYKEALKLKKDDDALFNLEMLKKQKVKRNKNEKSKAKDKKNSKRERKGAGKMKRLKDPASGKKMSKQQQIKKYKKMKVRRIEEEIKSKFRTLMIPLDSDSESEINNHGDPW